MIIQKPNLTDVPAYYGAYLDLIKENDLLTFLKNRTEETLKFIASIPVEKAEYRYAPGKWSIKEVLSHIIDTERILTYRALRFSRKDVTELSGFDENVYAPNANTGNRTLKEIAEEYNAVRLASISLFSYMTPEMLDFKGKANKASNTARGLGWMIAGHDVHHCNIVKERYLNR